MTPLDHNLDHNLLESLEDEYMELAEEGNVAVLAFAEIESTDFRVAMAAVTVCLLREGKDGGNLGKVLRGCLLASLAEHVAPAWALAEYPKRVAETEEMVAEWQWQVEVEVE